MSRAPSGGGEHAMLRPLRDESRELDPAVRASMERSMDASFGDVIVHTGEASSEAAEGLDAAAFTVGRHVVFGPGRYDPSSLRGRMLLAHELTHVVEQQRGGGDPDLAERAPALAVPVHADDSGGHARTAAQAALGGSTVAVGATPVGVARQTKAEEARTAAARSPEQVRRGLREGLKNVADWARYMRAEHERTLDETSASSLSDFADTDRLVSRGIGVYSDIVAGVTPPDPRMWGAVTTPVENGLAALDKDDLKGAAFWLKSAMAQLTTGLQTWDEYCQARIGAAGRTADKLKPAATVGRGVLGAVSQLSQRLAGMIDTIIWLDATGQPSRPDSLGNRAAKELGLINPKTGRPALTPAVESFYENTRTYLYQGQEDPLIGAFEVGELTAAVAEEVALPATGPLAAAVVSVDVATAFRTVAESVEACTDRQTGKVDVERLLGQESFWLSISQAALTVAGIQARSTGRRLTRFLVRYGSSLISGSQQLVELIEAFEARNTPAGKKRFDRAARAFLKFLLVEAVRAAKQRGAAHEHAKGGAAGDETPPPPRGASEEVSPQSQTGKPPDLDTTKPAKPLETGQKAPDGDEPQPKKRSGTEVDEAQRLLLEGFARKQQQEAEQQQAKGTEGEKTKRAEAEETERKPKQAEADETEPKPKQAEADETEPKPKQAEAEETERKREREKEKAERTRAKFEERRKAADELLDQEAGEVLKTYASKTEGQGAERLYEQAFAKAEAKRVKALAAIVTKQAAQQRKLMRSKAYKKMSPQKREKAQEKLDAEFAERREEVHDSFAHETDRTQHQREVARKAGLEALKDIWAAYRKAAWKKLAIDKLESLKAGAPRRVSASDAWDEKARTKAALDWNPIDAMTVAELRKMADTGSLPKRLNPKSGEVEKRLSPEIEHQNIQQTVAKKLVQAGGDPVAAAILIGLVDPAHLKHLTAEQHAKIDAARYQLLPADRKKLVGGPPVDVRPERPLANASPEQIEGIVGYMKDPRMDRTSKAWQDLRKWLTIEQKHRPEAVKELP